MSDFQDKYDQQLDRNLREIGRQITMPSPSNAQQAGWRNEQHPAPHLAASLTQVNSKGARFMRQRRLFAVFGSAAAAVVVMCGFLLVPGGAKHVEAATIWRNLRETLHRGFKLEMQQITIEKISVAGRVDVLFPKPIKLIDLIDDEGAQEPSDVYVEVSVVADEDADEVGGMQLRAAGAFNDSEKWLFARFDRFPDKLTEDEPVLNLIVPILKRGVLLDLGDLDLAGLLNDDEDTKTGASKSADIGLQASFSGSNREGESQSSAEQSGKPSGLALDLETGVDQTVRQLLSGTLKHEDFPLIVAQIETLAQDTRVEQAPDGAWVLTARNFQVPDDDPEAAALLKNAALRVEYVEGDGIRLAELTQVGDANGVIRFSFIDAPEVHAQTRQQYVSQGVTVIDGKFLEMFGWTPAR